MKYYSLIKLLRPHQWLKNLLVIPLFFLSSKSLDIFFNPSLWLVFICFSIIASGVYCANDVIDINNDKKHPVKKLRPIASGDVTVHSGILLSIILVSIGLYISWYINLNLFFLLCGYLLLNIFYNLIFKKLVFIDVFVLTLFYIIRVISAASLPDFNLSYWFVSFSFFLFLSLAFLKRCIDFEGVSYKDITPSSLLKDLFFNFSMISYVTSLSVLTAFFNSSTFVTSYEKAFLIYFLIVPYLYLFLNIFTSIKMDFVKDEPIIFLLTNLKSLIALLVSSLIFFIAIT